MKDPRLEEIKKLLEKLNGFELLQFLADDPELLKMLQKKISDQASKLKADQVGTAFYPTLTNKQGFISVMEMVEGTQNVNRTNISAVLAVASRRTREMKEFIDWLKDFFHDDMDEIAQFFRTYFEQVKGWSFNKMNRKDETHKDPTSTWVELANRLESLDDGEGLAFLELARYEEE